MASLEQCEAALHALAGRLADSAAARKRLEFDRTLSCSVADLHVIFTGHLKDGQLTDIARAQHRDAQVRITLSSDDLVALVDGRLKMAAAWASRRVRVQAGVRDLYRLRTLF